MYAYVTRVLDSAERKSAKCPAFHDVITVHVSWRAVFAIRRRKHPRYSPRPSPAQVQTTV